MKTVKKTTKPTCPIVAAMCVFFCVLLVCMTFTVFADGSKSQQASGKGEEESSDVSGGSEQKLIAYEDLSGKLAGVMEGTIQDTVVKGIIENPSFAFFTTTADECVALQKNKIDYVLVVAEIFSSFADQYPELALVKNLSVPCGDAAFVVSEGHDEMLQELNAYITELRESGELQKMQDYWFSSEPKQPVELPEDGEKGILKVASSCAVQPFSYVLDGKFSGLEAAVLAGFGEKYGYGLKVETMNFSSILAAIQSDKCQIASNSIFITEERKKTLTFSEPTNSPSFTILMRKDDITALVGQTFDETEKTGFLDSLRESFDKTFVQEGRWKLMAQGLGRTLLITFAAAVIGLVLGYGFYLIRVGKNKFFSYLMKIIKLFMSDTPIVVLLMIFYYIIFGNSNFPALGVAIVAFGLNFSTSVSELFYSTITSIDQGQTEAAIALGFRPPEAKWRFIIPQAAVRFIPAFKGQLITLLKGTSVVGYIAVTELTKAGDLIRSWTFEAFFPLVVVAAFYLLIAWCIRVSLGKLEKHLDPMTRRKLGKKE